MRSLKKVIASFLVVAILATLGATSVFAATQSIKAGDKRTIKTSTYTVRAGVKTASWKMSAKGKKSAKTVFVNKTVTIKGHKLTVNAISANALKGYKKLKTIKIKANITKISKKAFKGVKKSKLAKIKVKMKKGSVTTKTFKKLKAQLIKKGFKAKNITWY